MNMIRRSTLLLCAATVAGTMAGTASAQTQLSINYDGAYTGYVGVTGYMAPEDVYLTAFQATYVSGAPLPFPTTNPFNTFCVDISPNLVTPGTWTAGTFPTQGNLNGNTIPYVNGGIQEAANIYNHFVGNVDISTANGELWGAGLQVAIWSDLYGSAFNISGESPNVDAIVSTILTSGFNVVNPNLTSTFWDATDPSVNQDLIGPPMETGFVPEPGAYAAAASVCALVGLAGLRRKRAVR